MFYLTTPLEHIDFSYHRLLDVKHMVILTYIFRGNMLPPHRILILISSKASFIVCGCHGNKNYQNYINYLYFIYLAVDVHCPFYAGINSFLLIIVIWRWYVLYGKHWIQMARKKTATNKKKNYISLCDCPIVQFS